MNEDFRIPDPKIVPPPGECAWIDTGLSRGELEQAAKDAGYCSLDELLEDAGCWTVDEFCRMALADHVREWRQERKSGKADFPKSNIIDFPK
jgi:hypothetical protein